jgi:sugar lactone lactonase YvrE
MDVRVAGPPPDELGEGPCWLAASGELQRVDILAGAVHRWRPGADPQHTQVFGGEVAAAVPRAGGGLVLAVDRRLELVAPGGARTVVAEVEHDRPANRFNDCRADPAGRLWAGTMSKRREPGVAALYRLDPDGGFGPVLARLTLSNGIGWSPDGAAMYHVDSTEQRVDRYDYDVRDGTLGERRTLARVDPAAGLPDGLCVDAEGGVWLALFGGAALWRLDAHGVRTAVLPLPATNPTCPAFGGDGLDTLFVTTARHKLARRQLAAEPAAGRLLALEPGVRGLPANTFAG